jgi:hypothetical protein
MRLRWVLNADDCGDVGVVVVGEVDREENMSRPRSPSWSIYLVFPLIAAFCGLL